MGLAVWEHLGRLVELHRFPPAGSIGPSVLGNIPSCIEQQSNFSRTDAKYCVKYLKLYRNNGELGERHEREWERSGRIRENGEGVVGSLRCMMKRTVTIDVKNGTGIPQEFQCGSRIWAWNKNERSRV